MTFAQSHDFITIQVNARKSFLQSKTINGLTSPQPLSMVYWGDAQNQLLLGLIVSGEISPHTTDGNKLFNYTVNHFNGFQGNGSSTARATTIARLPKKLRNYLFDGTIKGTRKRAAQGKKKLPTTIHSPYSSLISFFPPSQI